MEVPINSAFAFGGTLLRDDFRRDDLKGERHRGHQSEECVDSCSVPKSRRAKESRNRHVIGEVDRRCQPGAQEQHKASRQYAGLQRLGFLHLAIHQGCNTPIFPGGGVWTSVRRSVIQHELLRAVLRKRYYSPLRLS